jgi:hypothetical protein
MTKALQALPPEPRAHRMLPRYPTLMAVGLSLSLSACTVTPSGATPAPFDAPTTPSADATAEIPDAGVDAAATVDGDVFDGGGQDGAAAPAGAGKG